MKYLLPVFLLVACGGTEIVYVPEPSNVPDAGVPAPDAKAAPDAESSFTASQALPAAPKEGCLQGEYDEVITPTSSNCGAFPVGVSVHHTMKYPFACQSFWNWGWYDGGPDSCMWRASWTFLGFWNTNGYTAKLTMKHECPSALAGDSCVFEADVKAVKM